MGARVVEADSPRDRRLVDALDRGMLAYMRRLTTSVLLVLVMFNIAHADLLRPCQCGSDNPYSCGSCPISKAQGSEALGEPSPAPC